MAIVESTAINVDSSRGILVHHKHSAKRMSTGDLKNNLKKLQGEVKLIKYEQDLDIDGLSRGAPGAYLPIYHYGFLEFSRYIAEEVNNLGIELSGKTDLRFIEAMYKILREVFSYKPPINKDQFFANSFVERKVIMCTEILHLLRKKHRSLAPKAKLRQTSGQAAAKLGPRPTSVPSMKAKEPAAEPDNKSAALSAETGHTHQPAHEHSAPPVIQVVNETRRVHFAQSPAADVASSAMPPPATNRVIRSRTLASGDQYNPADYGSVATVDSYDNAVFCVEPGHTSQTRPIDILPVTPAASGARARIPKPDVAMVTSNGGLAVMDKLTELQNTLSVLCDRQSAAERNHEFLEKRLGTAVESKYSPMPTEPRPSSGISPEQLETLLARVTLLESKMAMMEARLDRQSNQLPVASADNGPTMTFTPRGTHLATPFTAAADDAKAPCEIGPSPITYIKRDENPVQKSMLVAQGVSTEQSPPETSQGFSMQTTPSVISQGLVMEPGPGLAVATSTPSDPKTSVCTERVEQAFAAAATAGEALGQAERIKSMLQETEDLLHIQVQTPIKTLSSMC